MGAASSTATRRFCHKCKRQLEEGYQESKCISCIKIIGRDHVRKDKKVKRNNKAPTKEVSQCDSNAIEKVSISSTKKRKREVAEVSVKDTQVRCEKRQKKDSVASGNTSSREQAKEINLPIPSLQLQPTDERIEISSLICPSNPLPSFVKNVPLCVRPRTPRPEPSPSLLQKNLPPASLKTCHDCKTIYFGVYKLCNPCREDQEECRKASEHRSKGTGTSDSSGERNRRMKLLDSDDSPATSTVKKPERVQNGGGSRSGSTTVVQSTSYDKEMGDERSGPDSSMPQKECTNVRCKKKFFDKTFKLCAGCREKQRAKNRKHAEKEKLKKGQGLKSDTLKNSKEKVQAASVRDVILTKICSKCKKEVHETNEFKACDGCRERDRKLRVEDINEKAERQRLKKERTKKEREKAPAKREWNQFISAKPRSRSRKSFSTADEANESLAPGQQPPKACLLCKKCTVPASAKLMRCDECTKKLGLDKGLVATSDDTTPEPMSIPSPKKQAKSFDNIPSNGEESGDGMSIAEAINLELQKGSSSQSHRNKRKREDDVDLEPLQKSQVEKSSIVSSPRSKKKKTNTESPSLRHPLPKSQPSQVPVLSDSPASIPSKHTHPVRNDLEGQLLEKSKEMVQKKRQSARSSSFPSDPITLVASSSSTSSICSSPIIPPVSSDDTPQNEYQSASEMYLALNKMKLLSENPTAPRKLKFHGSYTIVADPDIDNAARVKMVASDLLLFAHLSFDLSKVLEENTTDSSSSVKYNCNCHRNQASSNLKIPSHTITSISTISVAPITPPTSSTGSVVGESKSSSSIPQHIPTFLTTDANIMPLHSRRNCKGWVMVTSTEDLSNCFVDGQRIEVQVIHPANYKAIKKRSK